MADYSVIKKEDQYDEYAALYDKLVLNGNNLSSEEKDAKALLFLLLSDWEKRHYSPHFDSVDPIDVLKYLMDERGWSDTDMIAIIGSRSKVSEVLNRKVPLSLNMIRRACKEFAISANLLIDQYPLAV